MPFLPCLQSCLPSILWDEHPMLFGPPEESVPSTPELLLQMLLSAPLAASYLILSLLLVPEHPGQRPELTGLSSLRLWR
ncbi:hypothetical protein P7K49_009068, partial [Saguinus oedipus]